MADLKRVGIKHPQDLPGKDAFALYETLCEKTGVKHDPCVIDVFMSAIDFMQGGEPRPWWAFTEKRKRALLSD